MTVIGLNHDFIEKTVFRQFFFLPEPFFRFFPQQLHDPPLLPRLPHRLPLLFHPLLLLLLHCALVLEAPLREAAVFAGQLEQRQIQPRLRLLAPVAGGRLCFPGKSCCSGDLFSRPAGAGLFFLASSPGQR